MGEMNKESALRYKIILNDIYPQCLASDLNEEQCRKQVVKLRDERPGMDIRVFTMDGDSAYW